MRSGCARGVNVKAPVKQRVFSIKRPAKFTAVPRREAALRGIFIHISEKIFVPVKMRKKKPIFSLVFSDSVWYTLSYLTLDRVAARNGRVIMCPMRVKKCLKGRFLP